MLTETVLTAEELQQIIVGLWEYNGKGQVLGCQFFYPDATPVVDSAGKPILGMMVKVFSEEAPLAMRVVKEEQSDAASEIYKSLYSKATAGSK